MKTTKILAVSLLVLVFMVSAAQRGQAAPLSTVFTYQGRLIDANSPADGAYDFRFQLYDAPTGGEQRGTTFDVDDVNVVDGYFAVKLDFGDDPIVFNGDAQWLHITVRPGGSEDPGDFASLTPRQELTPTPYAIYSKDTQNADMVDGYHAGNVSGQVAISNGTKCINLNSDMIDGQHAGAFSFEGHGHNSLYSENGDPCAIYVDGQGNATIGTTNRQGRLSVYADESLQCAIYGEHGRTGNYSMLGHEECAVIGRDGSGKFQGGLADYECGAWGENLVTGSCGEIGGMGFGILGSGHGADMAGIFLGDVSVSERVTGGGGNVSVVGNVLISGLLSKGGGQFKIDHPLDTENRYLSHSFVESPDMMNIYNGNVTLDENGQATVKLPEWFEALNRDFRYQLTCIGGFAPVYIAEEISGNRFKIAGGKAGMKVSWQVTGIRHDPYAEANRIVVETEKAPDERGLYLHPEAYGLPKEKGIETLHNTELRQNRQVVGEAGAQ